MNLAEQPTGSTASTNAKAALGLQLTIWTGILCALSFIFCVAIDKPALANDILWGWLAFLGAYLGINVLQRNNDRNSDYGKLEREKGYPTPDGRVPGAAPTVTKEVTITTEKATKETVAPAVPAAADPLATPADAEPEGAWPDGRKGIL